MLAWKIYAVLFVGFALFGAAETLSAPETAGVTKWMDLVAYTPISVAALVAYAFQRQLFAQRIWIGLFGIYSVVAAPSLVAGVKAAFGVMNRLPPALQAGGFVLTLALVAMAILPVLYALFRMAFLPRYAPAT